MQSEENGLRKEKTLGAVKMELSYRPAAWLAHQELKGKGNGASFEETQKRFEGQHHFRLRLESAVEGVNVQEVGVSSAEEMESRKYFMMFGMKDHLKMVCGNDTIPCAFYHFEQTYGLAPHADILIAFDGCGEGKDCQVLVGEIGFHTGLTKFLFTGDALSRIPELELN